MRRQEQHAELVAGLAAVRKEQLALQQNATAFLNDPLAVEKSTALQSLRDLLLLTPDVTILCAQTGAVVERIANANEVAEKMTREVRRIDIVQSRMGACLSQSSQLLRLRNSLLGIRRAMQQHDYPQAATFLKELKEIEQIMELDVADKLRLDTTENDLKVVIESCFETGLRDGDSRKVKTYAPLFQTIGNDYEERGYQLLIGHVERTLREPLGRMSKGSFSTKEHMEHLTTIFNHIAAVTKEYDQLLKTCFQHVSGPNRLIAAIYALGEDAAVAVLNSYMQQRKFLEKINTSNSNTSPSDQIPQTGETSSSGTSMAATESGIAIMNEQLNEMALVIQHTQTYERFMRSRVVTVAASVEPNGLESISSSLANTLPTVALPSSHESELGKAVQELAGYYCFFENDLLNKAARKAFQWEELRYSAGSVVTVEDNEVLCFPISSAVDEIFYVARNSGLRALATGHVDCAAGVLNMINTVLRDVLGDAMRSRIRNMATYVKFDSDSSLLGASTQLRDQMQQQLAKFSKTMGPIQIPSAVTTPTPEFRKEFGPDVVMNSLEATTEYIGQIKQQFQNELPEDFPDVPTHIVTCLNGLEEASTELTQLLLTSRKKLVKIVEPKIQNYLGGFVAANAKRAVQYELTEQMFTFNEANDPFALLFVACMRDLLGSFKQSLSVGNYRALVEATAVATEQIMENSFHSRHLRFNQLGALQFDKDIRVINGFFSETCDCREIFAPLTQIAMVLNADSPADVLDFYGRKSRGVEWKLSAARVKEILSRRVEFSDAAINKLVLT